MNFNIIDNLTDVNFNKRGTNPSWIVIHNTANSTSKAGTALANTQYFKSENRNASAHYFIDDDPNNIYRCVKDTDTAWHCGDAFSKNGCTNSNSVAIEVCEGADGRFSETETLKLAWLVKKLMTTYKIPACKVCRHYDITGKNCPYYYSQNQDSWYALYKYITSGRTEKIDPVGYEWVWYKYDKKWAVKFNGSWVYDQWIKDDNKWYRIDKDGWLLQNGWYKEGTYWYYLHKINGEMQTGWLWDDCDNAWYFLDDKGRLVKDSWHWDDTDKAWYYLKSDGKMATEEFVSAPGELSQYWINENGKWIR